MSKEKSAKLLTNFTATYSLASQIKSQGFPATSKSATTCHPTLVFTKCSGIVAKSWNAEGDAGGEREKERETRRDRSLSQ